MEKYMEPEMELVTFDSEDVIMTSGIGICENKRPSSCEIYGPYGHGDPD